MHNLPDHVVNLKRSLLSRSKHTLGKVDEALEHLKARISSRLPGLLNHPGLPGHPVTDAELEALSQTFKCAAARWIREALICSTNKHSSNYCDTESPSGTLPEARSPIGQLSPLQFRNILRMFVSIGEYSVLADTMIKLSSLTSGETLTAMLDTANYYHDIFQAIGASEQLFNNAVKHIHNGQNSDHSEQALLESLLDLGKRLPDVKAQVQNVRNHFIRIGANPITVACSPISDTIAESAHSTESNFLDELDHMFSTGSNIDRQTSTRVFGTLMGHLELTWTDENVSNRLVGLLSRLRVLDSKTFKSLVIDWLAGILNTANAPQLYSIIPRMICCKLLSGIDMLNHAFSALQVLQSNSSGMTLALNILNLLATEDINPISNGDYRTYRLRDEQVKTLCNQPQLILRLFQLLIEIPPSADVEFLSGIQFGLYSQRLRSLLTSALRQSADAPDNELPLDDEGQKIIGTYLLELTGLHEPASAITLQLLMLLDDVNEMNLLSSQMRLKALLCTQVASTDTQPIRALFEILIGRMLERSTNRTSLYIRLVSILSIEDARFIRREAENVILNMIQDRSISTKVENPSSMDGLSALVSALGFSLISTEPGTCLGRIAEVLSSLVQVAVQQEVIDEVDLLFKDIRTTLNLLILHQSVFQQPNSSQDTLSRIMLLLGLLLTNTGCSRLSAIAENILDVLYLLIDSLDNDSRPGCPLLMQDHYLGAYLHFEYDFSAPTTKTNDWLKLLSNSSFSSETATAKTTWNSSPQKPFSYRMWEMMSDATPIIAMNDTSLSLVLFGARKSVL